MPTSENRQYIEGVTNTPRTLVVDTSLGGDIFYRYDPYVAGKLDTVIGYTDGIEGAIGTSNTSTAAINGKLPTPINSRLPVDCLPASSLFATPSATTITTAVGTGFIDVDVSRFEFVGLEVSNTGATALNAFTVALQFHSAGNFNPKLISAADYTTNAALSNGNSTILCMESSASPVTLAGSGFVWMRLNVRGVFALRFLASVATGTTTLTIRGNGK